MVIQSTAPRRRRKDRETKGKERRKGEAVGVAVPSKKFSKTAAKDREEKVS